MNLNHFLEKSWEHYCAITPDAKKIHLLLSQSRREKILNDHVAYRTFNLPGISRLDLGKVFEEWGYERKDDMEFVEKKLTATYWLHPDSHYPKIFISELLLEKVSPELRDWIKRLTAPFLSRSEKPTAEMLLSQTWETPSFQDYEKFYSESEYAAWTAAFGIRVNHFTVLCNELKTFQALHELNDYLGAEGFTLNSSGGVIKGSALERLEQSSTIARRIPWKFSEGSTHEVMSCYYEFARRYPLSSGALFQGFIPKSADKIFESTYEKKT